MKNSDEIKLWKKLKKVVVKDSIHPKHGLKDMDVKCPECEAAILVAFINSRLDLLMWMKKNP